MAQGGLTENSRLVNLKLVLFTAVLAFIFVSLTTFYGTTFLPFVPDESLFLQPAQNLSEGRGMGTPMLGELLSGISQRTYWQPPVYFLALCAFGKFVGFNVVNARWFSRICAVIALVLLLFLAKQWGLPDGFAILCLLWTALDLSFQYSANLARMETLNDVWMLSCLIAFNAYRKSGNSRNLFASGVFGALATLTHFVTIPAVFALLLTLIWRKKREALWFVAPLLVGWTLWLSYAAQDWGSFVGQIGAQFARKGEGGLSPFLVKSMFLTGFAPFFGVFPTNSPPLWLALILLSLWAWHRGRTLLEGWKTFCLLGIYAGGALGGEVWYAGWFAPFGYLLLAIWICEFYRWLRTFWWQVFCFLLVCYQLFQISRVIISIPPLLHDTTRFFAEIRKEIPIGAKVLLHSIPDPYPILSSERTDLKLQQISPTPMPKEKLREALWSANYIVTIPLWGEGRLGIELPEPQKTWRFRTSLGSWGVGLYPLDKVKGLERD